jgi:hypothetical protein
LSQLDRPCASWPSLITSSMHFFRFSSAFIYSCISPLRFASLAMHFSSLLLIFMLSLSLRLTYIRWWLAFLSARYFDAAFAAFFHFSWRAFFCLFSMRFLFIDFSLKH